MAVKNNTSLTTDPSMEKFKDKNSVAEHAACFWIRRRWSLHGWWWPNLLLHS